MKRHLTPDEINDILSFIVPQNGIPYDSALSICNINKHLLYKQLIDQEIYPNAIPRLKDEIKKFYFSSIIPPGESVGIVCAQSIGHVCTQNTLNSFHTTGQAEKLVVHGTPRINELLNATKDPKYVNTKVYFKHRHNSVRDLRKTIGHQIVQLTLGKISTSITINLHKNPEPWYPFFNTLYKHQHWFRNYTLLSHCITFNINQKYLFEHKLTLQNIATFIDSQFDDLTCVFSPLHIGQFDIFVDTSYIDNTNEPSTNEPSTNEPYSLTASSLPSALDKKNESLYSYLEDIVQQKLEKLVVCGITGISGIYFTKENEEWIIETDGSNYLEILSLPIVDPLKTTSNNIWDIYTVLGIEAAREYLIDEFINIMDGINRCQIILLVERMTFSGSIASISRYTMRKDEGSFLAKISFEESFDTLTKSAINGETEPTKGVSASIICAKRSQVGTGMMDLKIDIEKLPSVFTINNI